MKKFVPIILRNKVKIILGICLFLFALIFYIFKKHLLEQKLYDWTHKNKYVANRSEINTILASFKKTKVENLPGSVLEDSKYLHGAFNKITKNQEFYVISQKDLNRKIVGHHRIKNFFSNELNNYSFSLFSDDTLYWGIDKKIILKVLELQDSLSSHGYDRNAFTITYGHRSPALNEFIGGAPLSRHLHGDAVDMKIHDINKDGKYTDEDKQIVLDLCDKYVINDIGGLGLYPGTQVVHMDVRGKKARWNNFKRQK